MSFMHECLEAGDDGRRAGGLLYSFYATALACICVGCYGDVTAAKLNHRREPAALECPCSAV